MSDTGWVSPGTVVSDDTVGTIAWSNPSNATSSDNNRASAMYSSSSADSAQDTTVRLVDETGSITGDNNATSTTLDSSDAYRIYGGSTDKWGETLSASDINDIDLGVVFQVEWYDTFEMASYSSDYLKATNFGFSLPAGSTIDGIEVRVEQRIDTGSDEYYALVDHIQIKVYYTESTGTPTVGVKYPLPAFKRS